MTPTRNAPLRKKPPVFDRRNALLYDRSVSMIHH
jgi:hypothetical protein